MPPKEQQSKAPPASYGVLKIHFQRIGGLLRKLPSGTATTVNLLPCPSRSAYRAQKAHDVISEALQKGVPDDFETAYRGVQHGMDEVFSTASICNLILGLTRSSLEPTDLAELTTIFEALSIVRYPTGYTGHVAVSHSGVESVSQHSSGDPLFASSGKNSQLADRARAETAVRAMYEALSQRGATRQSVLHAGMRAAVLYTLNHFAGPAAAMREFCTLDPQRAKEQTALRETFLKKALVAFGGSLRSGQQSASEYWYPNDADTGSPERVEESEPSSLYSYMHSHATSATSAAASHVAMDITPPSSPLAHSLNPTTPAQNLTAHLLDSPYQAPSSYSTVRTHASRATSTASSYAQVNVAPSTSHTAISDLLSSVMAPASYPTTPTISQSLATATTPPPYATTPTISSSLATATTPAAHATTPMISHSLAEVATSISHPAITPSTEQSSAIFSRKRAASGQPSVLEANVSRQSIASTTESRPHTLAQHSQPMDTGHADVVHAVSSTASSIGPSVKRRRTLLLS